MGKIFYLIEDVDVVNIIQRHGDRIQTALSSTQIIDGFFVHRTANGEGTADFLASLHEALAEQYATQPLYVLRDEVIDRDHYATLQAHLRAQHHGIPFHTSFHTFQALHGKSSATSSLQDVWTKMLLCIRRISPEKAQEIAQRWPTPRLLHTAWGEYERRTGDRSMGGFLCATIDDEVFVPRCKIGKALSEQIWTLLRAQAYVQ